MARRPAWDVQELGREHEIGLRRLTIDGGGKRMSACRRKLLLGEIALSLAGTETQEIEDGAVGERFVLASFDQHLVRPRARAVVRIGHGAAIQHAQRGNRLLVA
jgi:hypothetical protein